MNRLPAIFRYLLDFFVFFLNFWLQQKYDALKKKYEMLKQLTEDGEKMQHELQERHEAKEKGFFFFGFF